MSAAGAIRALAITAVLGLGAATARAWSSHEHAAQAGHVFAVTCGDTGDCQEIVSRYKLDLETFTTLYLASAEAPDFCHSFWHSKPVAKSNLFVCRPQTADSSEPGSACTTGTCAIFDGDPLAPNPAITALPASVAQELYMLRTNENHFGAAAEIHWRHHANLAAEAARRARDTCNPVCAALAIGLQGFADHYLQDRTATGHAWNQRELGYAYGAAFPHHFEDNLRGCFHGQGLIADVGIDCLGVGGIADEPAGWAARGGPIRLKAG